MKRNFLYLAVLTVFAVLVMVFSSDRPSTVEQLAEPMFVPELSAEINNVDRIEIIKAAQEEVASLRKSGDIWLLEQTGYRADWTKLRKLLVDLAQSKVVETKTDKPEYYARLGVEDVGAPNAASILLRLHYGEHQTAILVGHEAEGRTGRYVRLQDEAASALIDRNIEVPTETLQWLDSEIIDIGASEVAEVEVIHPDGEKVFVTRISADQTDFDLVGLQQGRELKSSWAVNSLGSVFAMLEMEAVQAEQNVDWTGAVRMRLLTFSGVEIIADLVESDGTYQLRLKASHPAAAILSGQSPDSPEGDVDKQAMRDTQERVESINSKVAGWAYGIAKYKYEAIVKKTEDLLKPVATP